MDFVEDVIRRRYPNWKFLHMEKVYYLPALGRIPLSPLKLLSRTILVAITTIIVSFICPSKIFPLKLKARTLCAVHRLQQLSCSPILSQSKNDACT